MKQLRRQYSEDFKREAVALVLDHGYSYQSAAESLGINAQLLSKLSRKFRATGACSAKGDASHQRIKELEAQNRRLRMERDILKKATAFFARESQ